MLLCRLSKLSDMLSAQYHSPFRVQGGAVLRSACMGLSGRCALTLPPQTRITPGSCYDMLER